MKNSQQGFIGLPILMAILLGIVVLGGGAYYVVHQQAPTQTTSDNFDNVQALPTNTTTSNQTPTQTTQTNPNTNVATTFSVPGSFTLTRGQKIKQTGATTPVSITYKDVVVADSKGPAEYCPSLVLSNGVAPDQTVTICPDNPNYLPYLYQGVSIMLTNSSANNASFTVSATTQAPVATIDKSSLSSNSGSPTLTGTATNLDKISIEIKTSSRVVSPDTAGNIGYISVVNGHWSATFSAANLAAGTYAVTVYHPFNRTVLATGVLTINSTSGSASGMSRYTDTDFGFSFYYPQDWKVVKNGNVISVIDPKDPNVGQYGNDGTWVSIKEISASTVESRGLFSDYTYTYDSNAQQWMYNLNVDCGESGPSCVPHYTGTAASVVVGTTIGGYLMFPGGASHGSGNTLVPLSGNKMLELAAYSTGASSFVPAFAGTITAPNATVDSTKLNAAIQTLVNDHYYQQEINYEKSH